VLSEVSSRAAAAPKFDEDFKQGAMQLLIETGKPIGQVPRDLGELGRPATASR
jgi:hypothetical protein